MTNVKWIILCAFLIGCIQKPNPTVLVVGDSISLHYGPWLMDRLKEKYVYKRILKPLSLSIDPDHSNVVNGEDSRNALDLIREFGEQQGYPDYLLVNTGLHDIKTSTENGIRQIEPDEYKSNVESIVNWCRKSDVKMIWVTTTPVRDEIHNRLQHKFLRYNSDVVKYNAIALEVMEKFDVPVIDLHSFTLTLDPDLYSDHVHFNDEVRKAQAEFIFRKMEELANR